MGWKSVNAHKKLEENVKLNRLYYAVFHSEPSERTDKPDCRYAFAVGVSPITGNLVGICALSAPPAKGAYERGVEAGEDEEGEDKGAILCDGAIQQPDANPDGSPQHLFYERKDESVLEKKILLWGGYKGIASFKITLTNEITSTDTDRDIEFLKAYQFPYEMHFGSGSGPVFRFICVPEHPYLAEMPTGNDIIRDLGYEKHFQGRQRGLKGSEIAFVGDDFEDYDQLHTDRNNQHMFMKEDEDNGGYEDLK